MGAGTRDELLRAPADLPAAARAPELDLDVAALRVELDPRFVEDDDPLRDDIEEPDDERLDDERPDDERPDDALRAADVPDADADRPRDFVLFVLFLLPPRDELLPRDFPRDFLALVAIDASPRSP